MSEATGFDCIGGDVTPIERFGRLGWLRAGVGSAVVGAGCGDPSAGCCFLVWASAEAAALISCSSFRLEA